MNPNISGVLPVWKPTGITSFDVIRDLRRGIPDWKKLRTGHGGTLDPMAVGVLPILVGEGTKAFDFLLQSDKVYTAVVQAGIGTDTDDADGRATAEDPRPLGRREVEAVLPRFVGRITQVPPRYSALKINGVRSYRLAREDEGVDPEPREVTVHSLDLLDFDEANRRFTLRVRCSSGTYIRAIGRDIGAAVGIPAHLSALTRNRSGGIDEADSVPLGDINAGNWEGMLIPLERALSFLPPLELKEGPEHLVHGRPLYHTSFVEAPGTSGAHRVMQHGAILAVVDHREGRYRYLRVFHAGAS